MKDLTGETFGRLTVLSFDEARSNGNRKYWLCRCECGKEKSILSTNLTCGYSKSCGCLGKANAIASCTKHGGTRTRLYTVWCNMRRRCYEKSNKRYDRYGGRGITVCDEWLDFGKFREWAYANGYDESAKYGECTLDRIDVNGNYEPNNCRWATIQQQNFNRSNNHILTYNGLSMSITEWEDKKGYKRGIIDNRIRKGWSVERAIETVPQRRP